MDKAKVKKEDLDETVLMLALFKRRELDKGRN